jgi:hypothetical protein
MKTPATIIDDQSMLKSSTPTSIIQDFPSSGAVDLETPTLMQPAEVANKASAGDEGGTKLFSAKTAFSEHPNLTAMLLQNMLRLMMTMAHSCLEKILTHKPRQRLI